MYDPVLLLASLVGAVAWLVGRLGGARSREPRTALVALALAGPYLVVIGSFHNTFQRFVVPLVPFLAILGALGASRIAARLGARSRRVLVPLGVALLVGVPAANGARLAVLRARPDTYELATRWLEQHADPVQTRIRYIPPLSLPPLLETADEAERAAARTSDDESARIYWLDHQIRLGAKDSSSARWRIGPANAGVDLIRDGDVLLIDTSRHPHRKRPRPALAALRARSWRVALFPTDGRPLPLEYTEEPQIGRWYPLHFLRLWRARAIGPPIEIRLVRDSEASR